MRCVFLTCSLSAVCVGAGGVGTGGDVGAAGVGVDVSLVAVCVGESGSSGGEAEEFLFQRFGDAPQPWLQEDEGIFHPRLPAPERGK